MDKIIKTESVGCFVLSLRSDGILHYHNLSTPDWNEKDQIESFVISGRLLNHKKVPMLHTYEKSTFPKQRAMEMWTNEATSTPYSLADAFVTKNQIDRMFGKFFFKFYKPLRPTAFFDDVTEAIDWLKKFL